MPGYSLFEYPSSDAARLANIIRYSGDQRLAELRRLVSWVKPLQAIRDEKRGDAQWAEAIVAINQLMEQLWSLAESR